jgi:hypothetical protein
MEKRSLASHGYVLGSSSSSKTYIVFVGKNTTIL